MKTLVWAHRGASKYAPENTMPSFKKAIEMKADGIELDVQLTKDGKLVVIHDETVDRTSDGHGWVKDIEFDEIRKLNFNNGMEEYGFVQIPTLEEVIELIKDTELSIDIEIKTGIVFYENIEEMVLELIEKHDIKDRTIISSFNHYTLRNIREKDAEIKTGVLYMDGPIDVHEYAIEKVGANALHPVLYDVQFENFYEKAAEFGLDVNVWTVDDEKYIRMLCAFKTNAVITNDPELARAIVDQYEDGKLS